MLKIFPSNTINATSKRGKNLSELISPSLFPRVHNQHSNTATPKPNIPGLKTDIHNFISKLRLT